MSWKGSLHEVRRTCRTSPAKTENVRRGATVKFNQMSGEEVKMSGEAQKNFVYSGRDPCLYQYVPHTFQTDQTIHNGSLLKIRKAFNAISMGAAHILLKKIEIPSKTLIY